MNEKEIREQLDLIRESCDTIDSLLTPEADVIAVKPGDNLASMIDSSPASSVFSIDPAFIGDYDLELNKPVTLLSSSVIIGRADPKNQYPQINGSATATAIVNMVNMRINGMIKEKALVVAADGFHIEASVIYGSPQGQHRGMLVNCKDTNVLDCWIGSIFGDIDTQAIAGWDKTNNLKVENCYLEASGENVLFGGADASSEEAIPQDIVIDSCEMNKLLIWKNNPAITCKNLFELKNAKRVKMSNCKMSNSWRSGQDGYAILLNVRNQDGNNPYATIEDVEISDCSIADVGAGIQILGQDYSNPSKVMTRVMIERNMFKNIDGANGAGRQIFISRGSQEFSIEDNEFQGVNLNSALSFDDPTVLNTKFSVIGNYFQEGDYGIIGTGAPNLGEPALAMYAPSYNWTNNTIKKGTSGRNITYPPSTIIVP